MPTSRPVRTFDKLSEILVYYSDIRELRDEMEEWRDRIPALDKYNQVDNAANTLESGHSDLEDACDNIKKILQKFPSVLETDVPYTEHKMYKGYSKPRWVRLANPVAAIEAAASFLEQAIPAEGMSEHDVEEVKQYLVRIDSAVSDLNKVEFPSMFG